ncbi:DNA-binding protein RHL1 [Linum grandiflorum]
MVRASKKAPAAEQNQNPDAIERKRLKKLAFSNGLLSPTPANNYAPLAPAKTVVKHHGKDILRKSQRKNRFLFSFSGLLAPVAGGKIGELKDLGTKNPILYLDFPQGRMKLLGTIVYPKNRYLTLQFSRGGKNAMCEDHFDNMVVFSEAWWIGTKEENPDESKLDFPKELIQEQKADYDFQGGAGAEPMSKKVVNTNVAKDVEEDPPESELEKYGSDDMVLKEVTPVRHSERTAGRRFRFTDVSSDENSGDADVPSKDEEEEEGEEEERKEKESTPSDTDINDSKEGVGLSAPVEASEISELKPKRSSKSNAPASVSTKASCSKPGSLVQASISTLFSKMKEKKNVDEKNTPKNSRKSKSSKAIGDNLEPKPLKRKLNLDEGSTKRGKVMNSGKSDSGMKAKKKVVHEIEEDDIEEFSGSSQDEKESDEDWEA